MGAAGLDASAEGGLQALGAIGKAYGDIESEEASNALEIYKAQLKAMGKKKGGGGAAASGAAIVNDDIGRALTLLQDDNEGFFTNLFQGDLLPATGFGAYLAGSAKHRRKVTVEQAADHPGEHLIRQTPGHARSQPDWRRTRPGQHLRTAEPDGCVRLARAVAVQ